MFKNNKQPSIKIDVVDVCSTLAAYFSVDIPYNSIGVSSPHFQGNLWETNIEKLRIFKQNLLQLSNSAYERGYYLDPIKKNSFLSIPEDSNITKSDLKEFKDFLENSKLKMYSSNKIPYFAILFSVFVCVYIFIYLLTNYGTGMEWYAANSRLTSFSLQIMRYIIVYGIAFFQIGYLNWRCLFFIYFLLLFLQYLFYYLFVFILFFLFIYLFFILIILLFFIYFFIYLYFFLFIYLFFILYNYFFIFLFIYYSNYFLFII